MPSLILVNAWNVGNMMVIYIAAILEIPTDLYEAAKFDGASA